MPHLLGDGIAVFPRGDAAPRQPRLRSTMPLPLGMVMLDYAFDA